MTAHIETRFLRVRSDAASLRDFVARAGRDLATDSDGTLAAYPEFRADLERAVALARAELGRIEAAR